MKEQVQSSVSVFQIFYSFPISLCVFDNVLVPKAFMLVYIVFMSHKSRCMAYRHYYLYYFPFLIKFGYSSYDRTRTNYPCNKGVSLDTATYISKSAFSGFTL